MVDNERPTTSPAVSEKREPPTGSTVQPVAQSPLLAWLRGEAARSVVADMVQDGNIKPEHQDEAKKVTAEVSVVVAELKKVARGEKPQSDYAFLPTMTQEILARVDLGEGDIKKVPLLVVLLEKSAESPLSSARDIEGLMKSVLKLKTTDPDLAKEILTKLSERARGLDVEETISEWVREQIDAFLEVSTTSSSEAKLIREMQMEEVRREHDLIYEKMQFLIESVVLSEAERIEIERRVAQQYTGETISHSDIKRFIDEAVERRNNEIRAELRTPLLDLSGLGSEEERQTVTLRFIKKVSEFASQGALSPEMARELREGVVKILDMYNRRDAETSKYERRGRDIIGHAEQLGIEFTDYQERLLNALEDTSVGKVELIDYLTNYSREHGVNWWDDFQEDVKAIFDVVLSQADSRPQDFFNEAFSDFHEGHLYDKMLRKLRTAGESLSRTIIPESLGTITINDVETLPSRHQYDSKLVDEYVTGKRQLAYENRVEVSLAHAIGSILETKMIKNRERTEYFHNVEVISEQGMGFEQLAKYAERFTSDALDDLWREDKDLYLAYNYYIGSLFSELGSNNRDISTKFGRPKNVDGLDDIQRRAYHQLRAHLRGTRRENESEEAFNRRIKRKIRMASGISKGATGEFWAALLTSKMLVSWEKNSDGSFKIKQLYSSGFHGGMEKMLSQIDLDKLLERFGVPAFIHVIRYVYEPRDLENSHGPRHEKYDGKEKMYSHTNVYEVRKWKEDAYMRGRNDHLAEFEESNVVLAEWLKTKVVDLMRRGGWRFEQYQAFLDYDEVGGEKKLRFEQSLYNMQKVGLYLIQRYIDDLVEGRVPGGSIDDIPDIRYGELKKRIKKLKGEDNIVKRQIEENFKYRGSYTNGEKHKLHEIEKAEDALKEALYANEMFQRVIDMFPSKMLSMERRGQTPLGEDMIQKALYNLLQGKLPDQRQDFIEGKIMPLFVSAVDLAYKIYWEKQKVKADAGDQSALSYIFNEEMLLSADAELKDYFEHYKGSLGTIIDKRSGREEQISLEDMSYEQFRGILVEFFGELKKKLDPDQTPRWSREKHSNENKQTLAQRYAHLLRLNLGDVETDIAGDDFDWRRFLLQQSGKRPIARFLNETNEIATKVNPALVKLLNEGLPAFVKGHYDNYDQVVAAVEKILVPIMLEIHNPIMMIDQGQAWDYCKRLILFITRSVGKDRIFRIKYFGPAAEDYLRRSFGRQSSLMADHFVHTWEDPTYEADSDGVYAIIKTLAKAIKLPDGPGSPNKDAVKVKRFETLRKHLPFFDQALEIGKKIPIIGPTLGWAFDVANADRPLYNENPHHMGQLKKVEGVKDVTWDKFIENWPVAFAVVLAIIIALFLAARKKGQESHQ